MNKLDFGAAGISVSLDLDIGHIADLVIRSGGRGIRPLHRAPWIDEPATQSADWSPGTKGLSGDFLCAPFSASDIEDAPLHGWPANSRWQVAENGPVDGGWRVRLQLDRKIFGATVDKILIARDGHPFLYQEHVFRGGQGELPAAHHPMTMMRDGGRLGFSPKRLAMTPDTSLEPDASRGRYVLAYPGRATDLRAFPRADGGVYDLTVYPAGGNAEDFVILVEDDHQGLGWTAVARQAEADLFLVLKNPSELPVTMLWISNGGRDYAPWNGRHRGVLGVEDGRTALGHAASLGDNALKRLGVPTSFALRPDGAVGFRHVLGAVALPDRIEAPVRLDVGRGAVEAVFAGGEKLPAPFDDEFLGASG